ncbi:MAG: bifunctional hydroxymethylpyrimidine kinase/phosphomethylpyrimidine kinase, partial [Acetobacteraceae bacterium]
ALLGTSIHNARDAEQAGEALRALGAKAVLLKGGHGRGREVVDRWFDARGMLELRHLRLPGDYHGTGCTLSSALAAQLAKGCSPRVAARRAIAFVQRALKHAYTPGMTPLRVLAQRPR